MNHSLAEQVALWCTRHGYPINVPSASTHSDFDDKYEGIKECFRNVIRTNNSRKLQYCKQ